MIKFDSLKPISNANTKSCLCLFDDIYFVYDKVKYLNFVCVQVNFPDIRYLSSSTGASSSIRNTIGF